MGEKELENQLMEAGTKLLEPPSSVEELLSLLDVLIDLLRVTVMSGFDTLTQQVEFCLARVEQSPSKSMDSALKPSLKALVASDLLRHADSDVKVSIASCVSEVTRISAPEAPYTDDEMKQIFQLIVGSFEKLYDTFSRSYAKRVSILETVAKVRSCVVMLDLECDGLILEMFQHFLKVIRDDHPENVFSSMETIMTLVLEESEEIPPELLYPLLTSVKKENQDILPIARKLGEKVLEKCSTKLKPYLVQAVKSMGMSPDEYSRIVGTICQESSDTTEHNDDSVSGEHPAAERSLPKKTAADKAPQGTEDLERDVAVPSVGDAVSEKSVKFMTSNGDAEMHDASVLDSDSPKKGEEVSQSTPQVTEVDLDNLDAKAENKPDPVIEKRGRKPNSSNQISGASGNSNIDNDKETVDLPDQGKTDSKEDNLLSEDHSISKSALPSESEKEGVAQVPSLNASCDGPIKVASPSPSQNTPDVSLRKRGRPRKGNTNEDTGHTSPTVAKEALSSEPVESDTLSKRGAEGDNLTQEKGNRRSGKKGQSDNENEDNTVSKKSSDSSSDSETKPLRKMGKKVDRGSNADESSAKTQDKSKKGRKKSIPEKDLAGQSSNKKMVSSQKSAEKSASKNQMLLEETPKTKSKRKRTPKLEASEKPTDEDNGENLVGSKIKVWWPDDDMFYDGVVSYVDGDEEILVLKDELWEFVEDDTSPDGEETADFSNPDTSSKMPQKKKAKTTSGSGSKQAKVAVSLKKGKETSTSKTKGEVTKSTPKSKNEGKLGNKAVEETPKASSKAKGSIGKSKGSTPKTGSKSKDDTPKTGTKSKNDTPKTGTKSKDVTPKVGAKDSTSKKTKSKDDTPTSGSKSEDGPPKTRTKSKKVTPKTGSKSRANGSSAKGKAGTSKGQESDESDDSGKGKLLESAKVQETQSKSGKKRRRG
ncbi:hypothetical protein IFM89_030335 [Coptis chinensis]|uniref:Uncharacterized protein n=1 Tax=Coptis chinensis TaxID=261450 RepID=A0A835M1V6_9MAGN|nr:hypothetical protein IFM89_030335 [Coptis chinensis]